MRTMIAVVAVFGVLTTASCREARASRASDISATGIFGGAVVNVSPASCAGRATLSQGSAHVKDSCFTGDTNIVLCTDVTNASPVRCAPSAGSLMVDGTGSDVIAYARMR
jgi:hypothetical protein